MVFLIRAKLSFLNARSPSAVRGVKGNRATTFVSRGAPQRSAARALMRRREKEDVLGYLAPRYLLFVLWEAALLTLLIVAALREAQRFANYGFFLRRSELSEGLSVWLGDIVFFDTQFTNTVERTFCLTAYLAK